MLRNILNCRFSLPKHIKNVHTKHPLLAGHSKWANIKHIKAQKDGEKAAVFTRLSRQIRLAIQEGGSIDPAINSQLRSVMDEALRRSMPMASIQNSIKKSQQNKAELKKYRMELRYKQKVFAVCNIYTENFPGLKMEIAPILKKSGASVVDAIHMFDDFGFINAKLDKSLLDSNLEDRAMGDAIECGAEDVEVIDDSTGTLNFICRPIELNAVRKAIEEKGYLVDNMEHVYLPKSVVQLTEDETKAYEVFLQKLRSVPGVEDIYDNVQYDEDD